jgi:hypothetical protein
MKRIATRKVGKGLAKKDDLHQVNLKRSTANEGVRKALISSQRNSRVRTLNLNCWSNSTKRSAGRSSLASIALCTSRTQNTTTLDGRLTPLKKIRSKTRRLMEYQFTTALGSSIDQKCYRRQMRGIATDASRINKQSRRSRFTTCRQF